MRAFRRSAGRAEVESFSEFALSEWSRVDGREVLGFARYKSKRAVPERLQEVWKPATGVVLPERWAMPTTSPST